MLYFNIDPFFMNYIEQFITYIQHEKRFSKHTVIAYQNDLLQFQTFLNNNSLTTVVRDNVRSWVVTLVHDNVSTTTINRKISSLKSFYKYLLKQNQIKVLPTIEIAIPKQKKELPHYIPVDEMNRLLNDVEFTDDMEGVRDHLIISLLYTTGIRSAEILGLNLNNVRFSDSSIKVLGKRNKERIIPLTLEVVNEFQRFIKLRSELQESKNHQFVFITSKGQKIYYGLLYKIVNKYLSLVSKQSKTSPHVIRHSFATHMLNNGADLNGIKTILGHASLAATQIYTHNSIEQLKLIHNQAHPRGEQKTRED
jgi:integrase/recombinase XerC